MANLKWWMVAWKIIREWFFMIISFIITARMQCTGSTWTVPEMEKLADLKYSNG